MDCFCLYVSGVLAGYCEKLPLEFWALDGQLNFIIENQNSSLNMPAEAPQTSSQKEKEYVKVANAPGLYRHVKTGRYYGCKKVNGRHREHSLGTADRKIAERRYGDWVASLTKIDSEVEKTMLDQLVKRFMEGSRGMAKNTQVPGCRRASGA
jgi:hypothetical protein